MSHESRAVIISATANPARVCSSAARISTTSGDALEIFERSGDAGKNDKLIDNVLNMGHGSFIEHAVFTIAFRNVSVVVEQFIIEFRLASYTVKSRRYVDFGASGYYVPDGLSPEARTRYDSHVRHLFDEYRAFVDAGIPKEDARYLLPYCFRSNFYCTVNTRELLYLLSEMSGARTSTSAELRDLASQIADQLREQFPAIANRLPREGCHPAPDGAVQLDLGEHAAVASQKATLLAHTRDAAWLVGVSDAVARGAKPADIAQAVGGRADAPRTDAATNDAGRPLAQDDWSRRALEHVTSTFLIENLSLPALTHLARHRIQSLVIPDLARVDAASFILPATIAANADLKRRYLAAFKDNLEAIRSLRACGFPDERYLCLSGNVVNVCTTMNAREFRHFCNLRCCSRAQWEIRDMTNSMLRQLRAAAPGLYDRFGPSCFARGRCPEGRQSCGRAAEMANRYRSNDF